MRTIFNIFGKSPFPYLETHMGKVALCASTLKKAIENIETLSREELKSLILELSSKEHEADKIKNDIRNNLPRNALFQIDRTQFLEFLSLQDSIADKMEDLGIALKLRPIARYDAFKSIFLRLFEVSLEAFEAVQIIITQELENLLDSTLGGKEAGTVNSLILKVAEKEYEAKKQKIVLLEKLFQTDGELNTAEFYHWMLLINETTEIASISESLANRIKMILELR